MQNGSNMIYHLGEVTAKFAQTRAGIAAPKAM
jgi:hypothetical protein